MPTLTPRQPVRLSYPDAARLTEKTTVLSVIARLIASGSAQTRAQLVRHTGLARSSVTLAVDTLIAADVLVESGEDSTNRRGRPAVQLAISSEVGVIMVVDLTSNYAHIAIAQFDQEVVAQQRCVMDIKDGPQVCLDVISDELNEMLEGIDLSIHDAKALVISLPGPVDSRRGVPVRPPIMPGWDEFPVADVMSDRFGCPTLVDNDVNLMALGEARVLSPSQVPLLTVSVGTGIGGGLIMANGELHHGADGSACDIGHIRVPSGEQAMCNCGNVGCVEAIASGEAVTRRLRLATGDESLSQHDLERLVREGDSTATYLIRDAARTIGGVVTTLVHVFNPARIVIVGPLSEASDDLLAGIRSVVYQGALPLATRNLSLMHGSLGSYAALVGGLVAGIERVLSPEGILELIESRHSHS